MKKTTKGAFAAAAAAALLMGGAGSLAYWTDQASTNAGTITTGNLSLTAGTCSAWTYNPGNGAVTTIVPGDQITKTCTYTIGAIGDHITATPVIPSTITYTANPNPTGSTLSLNVGATYKVGAPGTAGTAFTGGAGSITSANNGQTLTATITATMPFGNTTTINANDTKNVTASLNNLTVTLTQTSTSANPNA